MIDSNDIFDSEFELNGTCYEEWSVDELHDWLLEHKFGEWRETWRENRYDKEILIEIFQGDPVRELLEYGVPKPETKRLKQELRKNWFLVCCINELCSMTD